jgi:hypothetical protein
LDVSEDDESAILGVPECSADGLSLTVYCEDWFIDCALFDNIIAAWVIQRELVAPVELIA